MIWAVMLIAILEAFWVEGQNQNTCRDPVVEKRLLADDVRFASPFYVIALPKNSETEQMDNICYTYFETGTESFNHIMSITNQDGSNKYHTYTKEDISNEMGLAEAKAVNVSPCTFHDYTLTPICNMTVFILYRCFIDGSCNNIDIGITPGTDVRVVLAASPTVSQECYKEIDLSLRDTSSLQGANYIFLPQRQKPQCVTKYNNTNSIGYNRAVGSKEVTDDFTDRFGEKKNGVKTTQMGPVQTTSRPTQATWPNRNGPVKKPMNNQASPNKVPLKPPGTSFQTSVSGPGYSSSFAYSQGSATSNKGYQPVETWEKNKDWSVGPSPWSQSGYPGETHYHTWHDQPHPSDKPGAANMNQVFYHVHRWDSPPPGCCRCN